MKKIIGIDIGGSTTKIVGFDNGAIFSPLLIKATDPIASIYGAFGKFISSNGLDLKDIERVMMTGVGSSFITSKLFGLPTGKVDEFRAIGMGGLFLSRLSRAIIISMGTGTALVRADSHATPREAGVRRLALFHHDPDHDDVTLDRLLDDVRTRWSDGPDEIVAAYEGLTLALSPAAVPAG